LHSKLFKNIGITLKVYFYFFSHKSKIAQLAWQLFGISHIEARCFSWLADSK